MKREIHKSYADLLEEPEWHEFSKRIKALRDHHCERCEDGSGDEVHHLGYHEGRKPWEYSDDEVMVLCELCHSEIHEYADRLWNEVLRCRNTWVIYECAKAVEQTISIHQTK